jgi:NADH pyrophosphatase NudC (nudix superfamily)
MSDKPIWERDVVSESDLNAHYQEVIAAIRRCPQCGSGEYWVQTGAHLVCDDCGYDSGPLIDPDSRALLLTQQEWDDLADMVRVYSKDSSGIPFAVRRRALAERIIEANQP